MSSTSCPRASRGIARIKGFETRKSSTSWPSIVAPRRIARIKGFETSDGLTAGPARRQPGIARIKGFETLAQPLNQLFRPSLRGIARIKGFETPCFRPTVTITTGPCAASPASRALKLLFTRQYTAMCAPRLAASPASRALKR